MPGKMARSDPRPSARVTRVLVAVSTSRLPCKRARKTRTLIPVWDSSGEFSDEHSLTNELLSRNMSAPGGIGPTTPFAP
jgi:hypothetical protein